MYLYFKQRCVKGNAAFTLAEVLIVLAIIGVVAAITIPSIMQSTQDLELKTAWKKEYSVLSQATNQLIRDNGGTLAGFFDTNSFISPLSNYIVFTKSCNTFNLATDSTNCWPISVYKWADGTILSDAGNTPWGYKEMGNDGVLYSIRLDAPNCDGIQYGLSSTSNACGQITVDINGAKGPNQCDKDVFTVLLFNNGIKPMGASGTNALHGYGDKSALYLYN